MLKILAPDQYYLAYILESAHHTVAMTHPRFRLQLSRLLPFPARLPY